MRLQVCLTMQMEGKRGHDLSLALSVGENTAFVITGSIGTYLVQLTKARGHEVILHIVEAASCFSHEPAVNARIAL